MKRILTLILALFILSCFSGCRQSSSTATVNFYYCAAAPKYHTQTSVIQPESRKIDGDLSDLDGILRLYLEGPVSGQLTSPFPSGTLLKTVQLGKEVTEVVLSDDVGSLSGIELMIACGCLAKTVLEVSQSEIVHIRAENILLNNHAYIEFTEQSFLSFS